MTPRITSLVLAAASVAAPLCAQRTTWIVSAAGGPGVHFNELPAAVAAAAGGDLIVVRTGSYEGFTTGKALTLLGEGHVVIDGTLTVQGLEAGHTFAMKRLEVRHHRGSAGVVLRDDLGRIHAEDVSVTLNDAPAPFQPGSVEVLTCTAVSWAGGTLSGRPGLDVADALVALTSVQVIGQDPCGSLCGGGAPAIVTRLGSTLYLSRTTARGGAGGLPFLTPPAPAISMLGGRLILSGDATTAIRSGGAIAAISGAPGLGGFVDVDPTVPLLTSGGAAEASGVQLVRRRIVSLTARGAPPGGTLSVELVSPAGDPVHLLASIPADPVALPFGTVFIDPRVLLPIALTVQEPDEHLTLSLPVPNLPALRGGVLAFQAGNYYVATQQLELSNPAIVVLH